jgi:hypothetical protein
MSELDDNPRSYSGALLAAIAVALLIGIGSLIWNYNQSGTLTNQQKEIDAANEQNKKLASDLRETDAHLKVATEELGNSLGLTQKQMDERAQEIVRREERNEADAQRLASAQKQTAQAVTAVSNDVSSVKTDVGGVKTDLGKTQNDLATTISQLTSMKGDLNGHSSLIARNQEELELLKHKGDRNYYEFTLTKGQKKPVGTVSLELKKADAKKSKFTLVVYLRRQTVREEGSQSERAAPVLQRQGFTALRDRGQLRGCKEWPDLRLSDNAEECAGSGYCSITAVWGASTRSCWYWIEKVKLRPDFDPGSL